MISRNPKYVEPKPGIETTTTRLTWVVALIVPIFVAILSFAAFRVRFDAAPRRLDQLQEQYALLASGIVLLTTAYIANRSAKKAGSRWLWVALTVLATAPMLVGHLLRIEFQRLMMVGGSSVLIWLAVVVPAFHQSLLLAPKARDVAKDPNGE